MQPIPRLSEKKACPIASITVLEVTLEKSGLKRKANPLSEPPRVSDLTATTITSTKSSGIIYLENFSMPFSTPAITIPAVNATKRAIYNIGLQLEVIVLANISPISPPWAISTPTQISADFTI